MWILSTKFQSEEPGRRAPKLFLGWQSCKWITVKRHGKQLRGVAVWGKLETPPPRDPYYILILEANLHSLLSFAWTLAPQIICDKILFSHIRRWFQFLFLYFFLFRFFFCYFTVVINFYKNYYYYFFFSWKLFLFLHVPGCSGMFRHVPECSMFLVLSTPVPINSEIVP